MKWRGTGAVLVALLLFSCTTPTRETFAGVPGTFDPFQSVDELDPASASWQALIKCSGLDEKKFRRSCLPVAPTAPVKLVPSARRDDPTGGAIFSSSTDGIARARAAHRIYSPDVAELLDGGCEGDVQAAPGESLYDIEQLCDVKVSILLAYNPEIRNAREIAGGRIQIPQVYNPSREFFVSTYTGNASDYYTQPGDTLSDIASRHLVPAEVLTAINPGLNWDRLPVGTVLRIPRSAGTKPYELASNNFLPYEAAYQIGDDGGGVKFLIKSIAGTRDSEPLPLPSQFLPIFLPDPPPRATVAEDISAEFTRLGVGTYGEIYDQIMNRLKDAGFTEKALLAVRGGLAVATPLERIDDNHRSLKGSDRWIDRKLKVSGGDLFDLLKAFVGPQRGRFRAFVFIVRADLHASQQLSGTVENLNDWRRSGQRSMPNELAALPTGPGMRVHLLVYQFDRQNEYEPLHMNEHSEFTALDHLGLSGSGIRSSAR